MPDTDGVTYNQKQIDHLLDQLRPENFIKVIVKAAVKVGEQVKNRVAVYPGPPSHPPKWASRKSRAFYFAMRRDKGLPAKYTRTSDPMSQKLGQSWVVKSTADGAIVGNPAEYADLVQSEEHQTGMHAETGWITEAKAVEAVEDSGIIGQILDAELSSYFEALKGGL